MLRRLRCCLVLLAALLLVAPAGLAQDYDLSEFPRIDEEDLPERHREWLDEDVRWIITDNERDVFLRLDGDARRDRFIEEFWRNRDPSPGTERNEYREAHYERLEHAIDNFGFGTPREGYETDRGRMWILLGRPQSISRLPNSQEAVPVEVWFYSVDPALGLSPFFYLIFFKENGIGEYRLYSPAMDGPTALLNASGQMSAQRGAGAGGIGSRALSTGESAQALALLRRVDPELGNAAASLVPGEGGDFGVSPLRSEMVLSRLYELPERLMPRATWAVNLLTGVTESRVRFETLPAEADAFVLRDPSGAPFVHFAARAPGAELNLNNFEDRYYVTFSLAAGLHDEDYRFLSSNEPRILQADLDEERARSVRDGMLQYMDRIPAIEGAYTLDLTLENNVSREFGRAELPVQVAEPAPGEVAPSRPLLVLDARSAADYDPFGEHLPFQLGPAVVIPAFDGPFAADSEMRVLWQLYAPEPPAEPLQIRYEIRDAADETRLRRAFRVDWSRASAAGVLDHLESLDLRGIPAGDYTLVAERDGGERHRLPLRIVEADAHERPFTHALRQPPPTAPEVQLERARQLRTVGRTEEAIAELDAALSREPGLEEALELQIELLSDAGRFEQLERLLEPRLVRRPNDAGLLRTMGDVQARLGEHYDAIRFYERARLAGAEETPALLNALASEYYAEGEIDEARTLLERSLELDADQPQIRRLLQELLSRVASAGRPGGHHAMSLHHHVEAVRQ